MATSITKIKFIQAFREKNIVFFSLSDVQKVFSFASKNTLKHLLLRLKKENLIEKLAKNKYLFLHAKRDVSDYEIANFLVIPSYISFESALSYYGILTQFPYRITSATLNKSRELRIRNKVFQYSTIKSEYFKDFVKIDNFLIAEREKAVFDYLYFIYKGLRPLSTLPDLSNYIKEKTVKTYIIENTKPKFFNFLKSHVKL